MFNCDPSGLPPQQSHGGVASPAFPRGGSRQYSPGSGFFPGPIPPHIGTGEPRQSGHTSNAPCPRTGATRKARAMEYTRADTRAARAPAVSRLQRVDGRALIAFGEAGLRDLEQVAPARVLFPTAAAGDFALAVTVTTAGGLTGGDRLALEIVVDPGASVTVVPQAAEKIYRTLPDDPPTKIETRISVGSGARCEWVSHEAILFDGSRMRRSLEIDLAADARILAMEMLVFGRGAMGETFTRGLIRDSWRIRRDGRLVWVDALHIDGDVIGVAEAPFGFEGARAILTMVHAAPDAETHLALARELAGEHGGATAFDNLLIMRMAGGDPQVIREAGLRAAEALRAAAFGLRPTLPSICYC